MRLLDMTVGSLDRLFFLFNLVQGWCQAALDILRYCLNTRSNSVETPVKSLALALQLLQQF
jgi:hypothetical protein